MTLNILVFQFKTNLKAAVIVLREAVKNGASGEASPFQRASVFSKMP